MQRDLTCQVYEGDITLGGDFEASDITTKNEWRKSMKKILITLCLMMGFCVFAGCNDADVASSNLSQDADNFKVMRKVTFINTVSDEVLYTVEGNFAIKADTEDNQLEITAKTGDDKFQKHFLGLSPTTVYIVEQLEWQETNKYNFKITIKPSALVPDVDVR